jgi:hypothetical protein
LCRGPWDCVEVRGIGDPDVTVASLGGGHCKRARWVCGCRLECGRPSTSFSFLLFTIPRPSTQSRGPLHNPADLYTILRPSTQSRGPLHNPAALYTIPWPSPLSFGRWFGSGSTPYNLRILIRIRIGLRLWILLFSSVTFKMASLFAYCYLKLPLHYFSQIKKSLRSHKIVGI